jgi:hypothetical protein
MPILAQSDTYWPDFFIEKALAFDIEIMNDYAIIGGMNMRTGKVLGLTMSGSEGLDRDHLRRVLKNYTIITFNGLTFDIPLVFLAMSGASVKVLKEAANHIIGSNVKWWEVEKELGVKIPDWLDHFDLMEPNPDRKSVV